MLVILHPVQLIASLALTIAIAHQVQSSASVVCKIVQQKIVHQPAEPLRRTQHELHFLLAEMQFAQF